MVPAIMIDLHSHYLPGVDDGAADMSVTIDMLRQAQEAGITHLLATPHINENSTPVALQHIQDTFIQVQAEKQRAGINIDLSLAGEIHFDSRFLEWGGVDWLHIGKWKKYMIFELPIQGLPLRIEDAIFKLGLKGVTPILAHPERNVLIQNDEKKLQKWIDQGCIIQLNAGSLTGHFGAAAKQFAFRLLQKRMIHIVCSDAHNAKRRNYLVLKNAHGEIEKTFGRKYADALFIRNPQRILTGGNIDPEEWSGTNIGVPLYKKWLQKLRTASEYR